MFWLGLAMFGCAMFGFGWLLTWRYVGSLGWERRGAHVHDDTCGVLE